MKKLITSLALALTALSGYAITPLWMRDARTVSYTHLTLPTTSRV